MCNIKVTIPYIHNYNYKYNFITLCYWFWSDYNLEQSLNDGNEKDDKRKFVTQMKYIQTIILI